MRGWIEHFVKWYRRDDDLNKIVKLREEQVHLELRRERIFDDIGRLEAEEEMLVAEGAEAVRDNRASASRRVCNQLFHLNQEQKRQAAVAGLISKRITVAATDIHNLTIVNEGKALGFDIDIIDELTSHAVDAEEYISQVNDAADAAMSLTNDQSDMLESAASFGEYDDIMDRLRKSAGIVDTPATMIPTADHGQDRVTPEELTMPAACEGV